MSWPEKAPAIVKVYAPRKPLPPAKIPSFLEYEFSQLTKEFGFKAGSIRGCPVVYVDYPAFRFIVEPYVKVVHMRSLNTDVSPIEVPIIMPRPIVCFVMEKNGKAEEKYSTPCLEPKGPEWRMTVVSVKKVEHGKIVYRDVPVSQFLAGAVSMKVVAEEVLRGIERGLARTNILHCFFVHASTDKEREAVIDHLSRTAGLPAWEVELVSGYGIADEFDVEWFTACVKELSQLDPDRYTRLNIAYILTKSRIPLIENTVSLKDILSLPHIGDMWRRAYIDEIAFRAVNDVMDKFLEKFLEQREYVGYVSYSEYCRRLSTEISDLYAAEGKEWAVNLLYDRVLSTAKHVCNRLKIRVDWDAVKQLAKSKAEACVEIGPRASLVDEAFRATVYGHEAPVFEAAYNRIEGELYDVPKMSLDMLYLSDDYLAHEVSEFISRTLYTRLYDTVELLKRKFGYEFELAP